MYSIRQNSKDVQKKLNNENTISVFNPKIEAVWYTETLVVSEVYSVHLHQCKKSRIFWTLYLTVLRVTSSLNAAGFVCDECPRTYDKMHLTYGPTSNRNMAGTLGRCGTILLYSEVLPDPLIY